MHLRVINLCGTLWLLIVVIIQKSVVSLNEPGYCMNNHSTTILVPVRKVRLVTQKPEYVFDASNPTRNQPKYQKQQVVEYEQRVIWKQERKCCRGYRMTTQNLCEPVCRRGCVANAVCGAPEKCECQPGYRRADVAIGMLKCVPICANGCQNGRCLQPAVCQCNEGFVLLDGVCQSREVEENTLVPAELELNIFSAHQKPLKVKQSPELSKDLQDVTTENQDDVGAALDDNGRISLNIEGAMKSSTLIPKHKTSTLTTEENVANVFIGMGVSLEEEEKLIWPVEVAEQTSSTTVTASLTTTVAEDTTSNLGDLEYAKETFLSVNSLEENLFSMEPVELDTLTAAGSAQSFSKDISSTTAKLTSTNEDLNTSINTPQNISVGAMLGVAFALILMTLLYCCYKRRGAYDVKDNMNYFCTYERDRRYNELRCD